MRPKVRHSLRRAVSALLLRLYPTRRVADIRIVFTDLAADRDATEERLTAVFETVRRVEERAFVAVKRYVKHVVIWGGHYTAYDQLGGVHLSSAWLADSSDVELAAALVHEATHLRLIRLGVRYKDEQQRARIERLCVKRQAAFLRRAQDGGADLAAELERALERPWWTDEAHRARAERLVSDAELPGWLVPLLHRRS